MTGLLQQALDAHGGPERWRAAQQVRVRLRSGGRMVEVRLQGRTIAAADPGREPRCVSGPMPRGWSSADSRALATAATSTGGRCASKPVPAAGRCIVRTRGTPFRRCGTRSRGTRWTRSTSLAALWNYVSAPLMLTRPGVGLREGAPCRAGGQAWRRLQVSFPADIPTHSRQQMFCFDAPGLLRRLDYTAEVFSRWARARNYCSGYREMSGIMAPTRRRVTLRRPGGRPLPGPAIVWIEIGDFELLERGRD